VNKWSKNDLIKWCLLEALGTAAVQLQKIMVREVTGGFVVPAQFEMVKSLGADYVIGLYKNKLYKNGELVRYCIDTVAKVPFQNATKYLRSKMATYISAPVLWFSIQTFLNVMTSIFGR